MINVNNLSGYEPPSNEELKRLEQANEEERLKKQREESRNDRTKICSYRSEVIRSWEEAVKKELQSLPQVLRGVVGQDSFHIANAQEGHGWMIEKPMRGALSTGDMYRPIFICENGDIYQSEGYSYSGKPVCEKASLENAASYFLRKILESLYSRLGSGKEVEKFILFIPTTEMVGRLFDHRIEDFISGRDVYGSKDSLYRNLLNELEQDYGKTHCFSTELDDWFLGIDPETLTPYETKSPELVKYLRERFDLDRHWLFRR